MMKRCGDSSEYPLLTSCCDSSHVVMSDVYLLGEILSRVPVKPLMRFKSVCKGWLSLIHKDRSFTDLHFTQSKNTSFAVGGGGGICLFMKSPRIVGGLNVHFSAELQLSEAGVSIVPREIPIAEALDAGVIGIVNGLILLANRSRSVRVFNPSTGQSTPWIQSMIKREHEREREEIQEIDEDDDDDEYEIKYINVNWFYFGYDPATMEHKVVGLWVKMTSNWCGVSGSENICEVMTVGGRHNNNLSWRKIDDEFSLPSTISPFDFAASSLYANGSIYWLRTGRNKEPLIIEFNVGSEKFRTISVPSYIIEEIRYPYGSQLIQIDGCLAVLAKKIRLIGYGSHADAEINDNTAMKMCVLYGNGDNKLKDTSSSAIATSSSASTSSNSGCYWIEETFMMPPFNWNREDRYSITAVPGTDLFFIRAKEEAGSSFYLYNWRKKSFSKKIQFFVCSHTLISFDYFIYKGSILPVI